VWRSIGPMQKVEPKKIDELLSQLEELPAVERPRKPAAAIEELAPAIDRALARGQDIETIRQMLEQAGIHLQTNSLRAYLRRASTRLRAAGKTLGQQTENAASSTQDRTARTAETPQARDLAATARAHDQAARSIANANTTARGHFTPKPDSSDI
jgi:hypothetical protein